MSIGNGRPAASGPRLRTIKTSLRCLVLLLLAQPAARAFGADEAPSAAPAAAMAAPSSVQRWDIFELPLKGPTDGNPFDVKLTAKFTQGKESVQVHGFYDGDGVYRVRFMPPTVGAWHYETASDHKELDAKAGDFAVTKATGNNHGPVGVANMYHFAYADGAPFFPISTTLYGSAQQADQSLEEQTLATLKDSPFNRIRMMVLPISYDAAKNAPPFFPFPHKGEKDWDFEHFDPHFFQHMEKRLGQLRELGIEAELILFHSRDGHMTNYDRMPAAIDDRYLQYTVARFSAYRNVWWNMANEFDGVKTKTDADWDRDFQTVQAADPYDHPRAIHQMHRYYDFFRPWVTYLSVQSTFPVTGFDRADAYRGLSHKPAIFDEVQYEGDIAKNWGHLAGDLMVERFWTGVVSGTYVTHGETFASAPDVRWISRGGKLVGESPKRIAFLRDILKTAPAEGINPIDAPFPTAGVGGQGGQYYLVYFADKKPTEWNFELPSGGMRPGTKFHVDVIDTWNMTISPQPQVAVIAPGADRYHVTANPPVTIALPGNKYMALRIQREDLMKSEKPLKEHDDVDD